MVNDTHTRRRRRRIALKDNVMCGTDSSVRTGVVASSRLDAAQSEIKVL